jgi:hypothetical protein
VGQVSKDFDLTETAVRECVKQAELDVGIRRDDGRGGACAYAPQPSYGGLALD